MLWARAIPPAYRPGHPSPTRGAPGVHTVKSLPSRSGLRTLFLLAFCALGLGPEEFVIDTFDRQRLTDEYYSEGLGAGDLNRDGHVDIVYGPYWFAGPKFDQKREIYAPKPQNREG